MTDARRANLYRELADLEEERARVLRELADAYDGAAAEAPPPAPSETRRPRRAAPLPGPVAAPSDIDRAKAREAARRLGHLVRG